MHWTWQRRWYYYPRQTQMHRGKKYIFSISVTVCHCYHHCLLRHRGSTNGYIQKYIKIIKHTRLKWLKVNTMLKKTCPYHIFHHTFTVLYATVFRPYFDASPNISNHTLNLHANVLNIKLSEYSNLVRNINCLNSIKYVNGVNEILGLSRL